MWIFLNDSFLSVVVPLPTDVPADLQGQDVLCVRARQRGDIRRVFPGAKEVELPNRDYAFRSYIPRDVVADALAKQVQRLTATNFKDSVKEESRHDAYLDVWLTMCRFQPGHYNQ